MPAPAETQPAHTWLGRLLGPQGPQLLAGPWPDIPAVTAMAQAERICSLTHWRLQNLSPPAELQPLVQQLAQRSHEDLLPAMLLEHETRLVLVEAQAAQVPTLLLKGLAVAQWAYSDSRLRQSGDIDLLVSSFDDARRLAAHLLTRGYTWDKTTDPVVGYELLCSKHHRPGMSVEIDIHWGIGVTPLLRNAFPFEELAAAAIALPALGPSAQGLGPVHALLHACINRGFNPVHGVPEQLRLLYDLVAITQRFSPADWTRLVTLASQRQMAGFVLNALQACTRHLGPAWPAAPLEALQHSASREKLDCNRLGDWRYMQWHMWQSFPDLPTRLRWLWHRLFPNASFVAHGYGPQRSYLNGLLLRLGKGLRKLLA